MNDSAASFVMAPSVLSREVDGEMVLLNLDTEQYYGLDPVGSCILDRITRQPFEQALEALAVDYEVDEATLRRDVNALLDKLLAAGLLHAAEVVAQDPGEA